MGQIRVTPTNDPAKPRLKIEYRDCPPAGSGCYYADEFALDLDGWVQFSKPQLRRQSLPTEPTQSPSTETSPDQMS